MLIMSAQFSYKKTNSRGFTLVELLVVIAIIAILSIIGVTVFSNVQKNARNTRRLGDIKAISATLEANKTMGGNYNPLQDTQFAGGKVPVSGPTGRPYCINYSTTTDTAIAALADQVPWGATCPATYVNVAINTTPPAGTKAWKICAYIEDNKVTCYGHTQ